MKRVHAYEYGAELITLDRNGDARRRRLVTEETRLHETRAAKLQRSIARNSDQRRWAKRAFNYFTGGAF